MHRPFTRLMIVAGLVIVLAWPCGGFTSENSRLSALAARLQMDHANARDLALAAAQKYGWPVRVHTGRDAVLELQTLENGRPVYYITHNLLSARTQFTDRVWPDGKLGLRLDGQGQTPGLWDEGGVYLDHHEFGGRVLQRDDAARITDHATHVAGTMVAAGLNRGARGMAGRARLDAYDWNFDFPEMAAAAATGLTLSNHSYGAVTGWEYDYLNDQMWAWFGDPGVSEQEDYRFGFYSYFARLMDELLHQAPGYLVIRSAGNDRADTGPHAGTEYWLFQDGQWVRSRVMRNADGGRDGYDTISGVALAKNVMTVGAVDPLKYGYQGPQDVRMTTFSSWGPADDGRIKPDIVADGSFLLSPVATAINAYDRFSGSSTAAPGVSGAAVLLQQHYRALQAHQSMWSSTLKALIIHTAHEAGASAGPDYQFGWGLMNTAAAAALLTEDSFSPARRCLHELTLNEGATHAFQVVSDGSCPLKVTACWTDPPGPERAPQRNAPEAVLINDIDLRVRGPLLGVQETHYPWILNPANPGEAAQFGDNSRDNVEQVLVSSPMAGTYEVQLTHKGSLSGALQRVSVVVSGHVDSGQPVPPAPALIYPSVDAVLTSDSTTLRWQAGEKSLYQLWVSTGADFSTAFLREDHLHTPMCFLHDLPANTTFYWRIRARNSGGWGPYSATARFATGASALPLVWQKITPAELDFYVESMAVNHQGHLFASLSDPDTSLPTIEAEKLWKTEDLGKNWIPVNSRMSPLAIDSRGVLFGRRLYEFGLTDAGKDGAGDRQIYASANSATDHLFIDDQDRLYMFPYTYWGLGKTTFFLMSGDNGATWTELSQWPRYLNVGRNAFIIIDGVMYLGTWSEGIYKSTDNGKSWQSISQGSSITGVYCLKRTRENKLIVGTSVGVFVTPLDHIQWRRITGGDIEYASIIDMVVKDHGLLYGISYGCKGPGAGFFASIDHGETWTQVNSGLLHDSPRVIVQGHNHELFLGIGTGSIFEEGAVYYGSEEKILHYLAEKLGVTVPAAVTLHAPAPDWSQVEEEVTLSWGAVPHAAMYQVQTSFNPDFIVLVEDRQTNATSCRIGRLGGGTNYYWRVRAHNAFGAGEWSAVRRFATDPLTAVVMDPSLPGDFALHQNYPNPFNPATTFAYDVPAVARVVLEIFDPLGRRVKTLVDARQPAGRFRAIWDATDARQQPAAAGVYFCRMQTDQFTRVIKVVLLR